MTPGRHPSALCAGLLLVGTAACGSDVTVTNDRKVGPGAKAVVVHPRRAMDNRLACAEF